MKQITTTELRTKSSALIAEILAGRSVELIHRAKIVGKITPVIGKAARPFNAERFLKHVKALNLPYIPYKKREAIYRKHLMKKYGHGLS